MTYEAKTFLPAPDQIRVELTITGPDKRFDQESAASVAISSMILYKMGYKFFLDDRKVAKEKKMWHAELILRETKGIGKYHATFKLRRKAYDI